MSDMFDDGEINQHIIGPDTALVVVDHRGYSALDAVVIDIDRPVLADFAVLETNGFVLGDEDLDILTQRALVCLSARERNQPSCR